MCIYKYGHVVLNDFIPMGCVKKDLKATAVDCFPKGI